jgi:hypothetical protein
MQNILIQSLQLIIALGLLNVWLLRFSKKTEYRGGDASNLIEEFAVYGLPVWFCYLIGFLKIGSAVMLLLGLWIPELTLPASLLVIALMLGAVSMHAKVKDPIKKALPAGAMLLMSVIVFAGHF